MTSAELKGGLGNIMFQIAATYGIAAIRKDAVGFDLEKHKIELQGNNAIHYIDNIFRGIKSCQYSLSRGDMYQEKSFNYSPIDTNLHKRNMILSGYFQSEKYFIHIRDIIHDIFDIPDDIKQYLHTKYNNIINSDKTVSLHVRRGDYVRFNHIHPPCDIQYFTNAIELFNNDSIFVVFSDDIPWCKQNLKGEFTFIEGEKDYIDIYLMSLCKDNIICNSSFSWWGAWLNKNINKRVIAPKKWFGSEATYNDRDIYCEDWIKV